MIIYTSTLIEGVRFLADNLFVISYRRIFLYKLSNYFRKVSTEFKKTIILIISQMTDMNLLYWVIKMKDLSIYNNVVYHEDQQTMTLKQW